MYDARLEDRGKQLSPVLRLAGAAGQVLPQPLKQALYRVPLLSGLIRRQLNLLAPRGPVEVAVAGGMLQGMRLKLDLKSEKYYWLGTYEPHLVQGIGDFCRPGMTVYDVGANIGWTSLAFARVVGSGGRVYAFEPLPANAQRIADNVALNSLEAVVHVVPCAASDREGSEAFLVHKEHAMGKLAGPWGRKISYMGQTEVRSIRLDDFAYRDGNPCPDLLKMDIEGGGVKAIPGMLRLLAERRPIVFMELHGPEEQRAAWDALKRNGYRVCRMRRGYPEVSSLEAMDWKEHVVGIP